MIRAKLSTKHVNFDDLHNGVFSVMYKNSDTVIDSNKTAKQFCEAVTDTNSGFKTEF